MAAKRNEPTEERQILFFDTLVGNGGNVSQAAEVANYARTYAYKLAYKYRDYLLKRVEGSMLLDALKAAGIFRDVLNSDDPIKEIPGAELKMKAGGQVLDRIGMLPFVVYRLGLGLILLIWVM